MSTGSRVIRISKVLSQLGLCSRREADVFLSAGKVSVNGSPVRPGQVVCDPKDIVTLNPSATLQQSSKISVVFNKPLGIVSTQPEKGYTPAIQSLTWENECKELNAGRKRNMRHEPRAYPKMAVCGRLDINSTGLLLFTQDGNVARSILSPQDTPLEKEYLVRISPNINLLRDNVQQAIDHLRNGVWSDSDFLQAKTVEVLNENQLRIVLYEGKHHHIRRMCRNVGFPVTALKRVRIGNIVLKSLPVGQWRFLRPEESVFSS